MLLMKKYLRRFKWPGLMNVIRRYGFFKSNYLAIFCLCLTLTGCQSLPPIFKPSPQKAPTSTAGWSESQVIKKLGTPQFKRFDGNAQVWQYVDKSCVLLLFLYQEQSELRVRYQLTQTHGGEAAATSCHFNSL